MNVVKYLIAIEKPRILEKAYRYLQEAPCTVTATHCERSAGGRHDFYSEGDYWWPVPNEPNAPYIRRDGQTNPDNFIKHRQSMMRLSDIIGTLTSSYLITKEETFAAHAVTHLLAWFVNETTRMTPHLLYGQAIKGRYTGRSIGVIDTIHLVEVARGAKLLGVSTAFDSADQVNVKQWFRDYLTWLNSHPYGLTERHHPNNHGVCWSLQAAAFADLVGDEAQLVWVREQFKTVYLRQMMNSDGGFSAELARTKPYGYSLFVIDAMAGVAEIASNSADDLWQFQLLDGRGMRRGLEFIAPFIANKATWPLSPDVMHWDEWPVRHPSLLFAGIRFKNEHYLSLWEQLESDPTTYEVLRNLPLRHPLLWV